MVRLAHERQIIGGIVACIMVKMGDGQARPDLQAAYDATAHRICGSRDLARFALLSDEGRHFQTVPLPEWQLQGALELSGLQELRRRAGGLFGQLSPPKQL